MRVSTTVKHVFVETRRPLPDGLLAQIERLSGLRLRLTDNKMGRIRLCYALPDDLDPTKDRNLVGGEADIVANLAEFRFDITVDRAFRPQ